VQTIVKDTDGGWPMLTKTNYGRVVHGDEGQDAGAAHVGRGLVRRRQLRGGSALLAVVSTEMQSSLTNKQTAKDA
jgi:hypothetical protein